MLTYLLIDNVAVIEHAEVTLGVGLHVLTGETGAGKSIIIDALNAVLGERTNRDIIRTGEKTAAVTAVFQNVAPQVDGWLAENGLSADEDGSVVVNRQISADGRALCRVCGTPVTVSALKQLGALLVNIHGQHDGQQLLDERWHLKYIDDFGETAPYLERYRSAFDELKAVEREIERLSVGGEEIRRRVETLKKRVDEMEPAELEEGEEEELEARRLVLRNAEKLASATSAAFGALYGGDDYAGATALLAEAADEISSAADSDPTLASLAARLSELRYLSEDCASELRDLRGSYDFSPDEADRVEGRLEQITVLERKYGASISDVLRTLEEYHAELDTVEFSEENLQELKAKHAEISEAVNKHAQKLSAERKKAAKKLETQILSELSSLDMPRARFEVEFTDTPPSSGGADSVSFLLSVNAGETPRPLSKIASGGELSRIMLAMKSVLSSSDVAGTLVFDEVDAGVSGRAAQRVAEKLASVAQTRQVLCVTHLPQIAAMADVHLVVEKAERGGRTYTSVVELDDGGRAGEVARITGGTVVTETTLKSAAELIENAAEYKKTLKGN